MLRVQRAEGDVLIETPPRTAAAAAVPFAAAAASLAAFAAAVSVRTSCDPPRFPGSAAPANSVIFPTTGLERGCCRRGRGCCGRNCRRPAPPRYARFPPSSLRFLNFSCLHRGEISIACAETLRATRHGGILYEKATMCGASRSHVPWAAAEAVFAHEAVQSCRVSVHLAILSAGSQQLLLPFKVRAHKPSPPRMRPSHGHSPSPFPTPRSTRASLPLMKSTAPRGGQTGSLREVDQALGVLDGEDDALPQHRLGAVRGQVDLVEARPRRRQRRVRRVHVL